MKINKLSEYKNGWLIGDFEPCLFNSKEVEIGILECPKGHISDGHYHKIHTEYNCIIYGKAKIGEDILEAGDIFIFEPLERSIIEYLEDTKLIVIKTPSTKNDKFY